MKKDNKVLSLKNDYIFKAVFGSDNENSKFILMSLLNKILDREKDPIVEIQYKNPFQLKFAMDDKETILDIKAITDLDEIIDIEMQMVWDKDMPERLLFYHGGLLRESVKEGEGYGEMRPTVTICIIDDIAFENTDRYMSRFYFMEEEENYKLTEISKICCIELPKVNPDHRLLEQLTPLEICLEFLRCSSEENSEYVRELIHRGGKELEMAQEIFDKITQEEQLREQALARDKYLRDQLHLKNKCKKLEEDTARLQEKEIQFQEKEERFQEKEARFQEKKAQFQEEEARFQEKKKQFVEKENRLNEQLIKIVKILNSLGRPIESIATEVRLSVEEVKEILSTD